MISKQVQSSSYEMASFNPVQRFAQSLNRARELHSQTLSYDGSSKDIDPRPGHVRLADGSAVASPDSFRTGDLFVRFDGQNAQASYNAEATEKDQIIREHSYDAESQTLTTRAYSVGERAAGRLVDTGAVEINFDLNKEDDKGCHFLSKNIYAVTQRALTMDNQVCDTDPRPGFYEDSLAHLAGSNISNMRVKLGQQQVTGAYEINGVETRFEVACKDGVPLYDQGDMHATQSVRGQVWESQVKAGTNQLNRRIILDQDPQFFMLGV